MFHSADSTDGRTAPWRVAVLLAAFLSAGTVVAAGGGGGPARHGDNPTHEKGSMSGNIAIDCTNFRVDASGVVTAECNTTTDGNVDPSSTSIALASSLHVQNVGDASAVFYDAHGRWWREHWPEHLTLIWPNGSEYVSRWKVSFANACGQKRIRYEDGNVVLEAECTVQNICTWGTLRVPANCTSNTTDRIADTKLNEPERGGGLRNDNGNLAFK